MILNVNADIRRVARMREIKKSLDGGVGGASHPMERLVKENALIKYVNGGWPSLSTSISLPILKLWVPRPRAFCEGGYDAADTIVLPNAQRLASELRRTSPALYHRFVLSAIALSRFTAQS